VDIGAPDLVYFAVMTTLLLTKKAGKKMFKAQLYMIRI